MTKPDSYLARIEAFNTKKGGGVTITTVQEATIYTSLFLTATDTPIARLNPIRSNEILRIKFWSNRERWQDVWGLQMDHFTT